MEMWLARDKNNTLRLFIGEKPEKKLFLWISVYADYIEIDSRLFPEVKWSDDEPTKVKPIIEK